VRFVCFKAGVFDDKKLACIIVSSGFFGDKKNIAV
jgi:hypothetical protein